MGWSIIVDIIILVYLKAMPDKDRRHVIGKNVM